MKKVLIITYYWPPSGGAGVQRWLKFVKYLRAFNWEPIIYTVENGEYPVIDNSLAKDLPENLTVIKTPIWEPYDIYKKFIGQKKDEKINAGFLSEKEKPGRLESISVWIRGNLFIPDARKFWIKPSIKYLTKYLKENPVDAIVSSGPPHSTHMIALGIKKSLDIPWVADFRDPWTKIDFYKDLKLSKWADKKHHKQERSVFDNADKILVIGKTMAKEFKDDGVINVEVITNGFDEDDINNDVVPDQKFSLAHIGSLVKTRNHDELWEALKELCVEVEGFQDDLKIKLVGKVDFSARESLKRLGLEKYLEIVDYLPHAEVVLVQKSVSVLLLLINNTPNAKGVLTGKFFEYLAAGRPILAIGPENGDVAEILKETASGEIVEFGEKEKLKGVIKKMYTSFKNKETINGNPLIGNYSRKKLTEKLAKTLNEVTA